MPLDPDTAELAIRTAIAEAYERSAKIADTSDAEIAARIRLAAKSRGITIEEWWIGTHKEMVSTNESLERLRTMLGKVDDPCKFAAQLIATLVEIAPLLPLTDPRREALLFTLGLVQADVLPHICTE